MIRLLPLQLSFKAVEYSHIQLLSFHTELKNHFVVEMAKKFINFDSIVTTFTLYQDIQLRLYGVDTFTKEFWPLESRILAQFFIAKGFKVKWETAILNEHMRVLYFNASLFPPKILK